MRDAALKKSERYMRLHGLSNDPDLREKYLRTAPARLALRRARAGVAGALGLNCADHRNAAGSCWRMRRGWSYHQRPRSHWWDESCVVRHKKFGRLMTGSGHSRPMGLIGQLTTRPQHIQ